MITKIEYIKNFGIFKNFNWSNSIEIQEFKEKNILYGWNYSGKTTLSRIFSSLRDKLMFDDYQNCDFKVITENGHYTKLNLGDFPFNILVFNSDYIKENLRWEVDDEINAIFFDIGDDAKIAKKIKELEDKIIEINGDEKGKNVGLIETFLLTVKEYDEFENSIFTDESRRIKNDVFLSLIEFNKGHFKKHKVEVLPNLSSHILKKTDIDRLSKIVQIKEPKETVDEIEFTSKVNEYIREANHLLISEPKKEDIIGILENKKEALDWVKQGLELHKPKSDSKKVKCLFCDNYIKNDRIKRLNRFYENEASKIREKVKELNHSIDEHKDEIALLNFPKSIQDLNEGFQESYSRQKKVCDRLIKRYSKQLEKIKSKLNNKVKSNIYERSEEIELFDEGNLKNCITNINSLIRENNEFSDKFESKIKSERHDFLNHLVAKFLRDKKFTSKEKAYQKAVKEIEVFEEKINNYQKEIDRLKALKSSGEEGGQQFNYFIKSFLEQEDIEIKFNKSVKKFNLFRNTEVARNLSEGEKMAISFSHFLVSLKSLEQKRELKKTILFIDDPISSLDGNHIFQINALLKDFLYEKVTDPSNPAQKMWSQKCLQLFVSTHNFEFFNLLKEMPTQRGFLYDRRNNKRESRYFISRKISESSIEKLPNVYDTFKSEYHFLFKEINDFNNNSSGSITEKLLLMPNILRRFLEIYTLAKYPSKEEVDDRATEIFGAVASKRICKPFHYFSHFNNIDRIGKQSEFLADVSQACKELIKQLKKDKRHYKALISAL